MKQFPSQCSTASGATVALVSLGILTYTGVLAPVVSSSDSGVVCDYYIHSTYSAELARCAFNTGFHSPVCNVNTVGVSSSSSLSSNLPPVVLDKIVSAIYRTEGSSKTKWPFGIHASRTLSQNKVICVRTVEHNWRVYSQAHPAVHDGSIALDANLREFIPLLADVYCPIAADPIGNANWKRNMLAILNLSCSF